MDEEAGNPRDSVNQMIFCTSIGKHLQDAARPHRGHDQAPSANPPPAAPEPPGSTLPAHRQLSWIPVKPRDTDPVHSSEPSPLDLLKLREAENTHVRRLLAEYHPSKDTPFSKGDY